MKKNLILVILVLVLSFTCISVVSFAASGDTENDDAKNAATDLYNYGLFKGVGTDSEGNPIFNLNATLNRTDAVVMLVRLLGKEDEALNGDWEHPFTDVHKWADKYVGYAYEKNLAKGLSATKFGADKNTTASQYMTFVLRALAYEDGVDFSWENPFELSDSLDLLKGKYSTSTSKFTRGDAALISYNALVMDIKGTDPAQSLYQYLVKQGVIDTGVVSLDDFDLDSEAENFIQDRIDDLENQKDKELQEAIEKAKKEAEEKAAKEAKEAEEKAKQAAANGGTPVPSNAKMTYVGNFSITFYCPCSKCCGKSDGITATGTKATAKRTIAVNPRQIPYGSKVYIEGYDYVFVAEDCGGGIGTNRIDIFCNTHQEALNNGRISRNVYIIE